MSKSKILHRFSYIDQSWQATDDGALHWQASDGRWIRALYTQAGVAEIARLASALTAAQEELAEARKALVDAADAMALLGEFHLYHQVGCQWSEGFCECGIEGLVISFRAAKDRARAIGAKQP